MSTLLVSQETAQWTYYVWAHELAADDVEVDWKLAAERHRPENGVRGLILAADDLGERALVRLELAFPEIVAAVSLTKSEHGIEVLRAIAANGAPA